MNRRQFLKSLAYGSAVLALPIYADQQQDRLVEILGEKTVQHIRDTGYRATHILEDSNHKVYLLIKALKPETSVDLGRGVKMDFVMLEDKVDRLFIGTENMQEYQTTDFQKGQKGLDNPRLTFREGERECTLVVNPNTSNKNSEGSYIESKQPSVKPSNPFAKGTTQRQRNNKTLLKLIWASNPTGLNLDK